MSTLSDTTPPTPTTPAGPAPPELRLRVDERRLLRELPKFFHSYAEALTELVQNAYRAGASTVTFAADEAHKLLTVADDGRGAERPETFITAAATGWNERRVIEPAGLGFFALLGSAQWVRVSSRLGARPGWTIQISRDAFDGAPIPCASVPPDGTSGVTVTAHLPGVKELRPKKVFDSRDFDDRWRQFFPLEVVWDDLATGERTVLPNPLAEGVRLDTPVGPLVRLANPTPDRYRDAPALFTVWEHRALTNTRAWEALWAELGRHPLGHVLADLMAPDRYAWLVDPASGVRPKLPDRREVIDDGAWRAAIRTLADALLRSLNAAAFRRRAAALRLRDLYVLSDHDTTQPSQWWDTLEGLAGPFWGRLKQTAFLRCAGYERSPYGTYDELHEEWEDDVPSVGAADRTAYVRGAVRCLDPAIVSHLLARPSGAIPAILDTQGRRGVLRLTNPRWAYPPRAPVSADPPTPPTPLVAPIAPVPLVLCDRAEVVVGERTLDAPEVFVASESPPLLDAVTGTEFVPPEDDIALFDGVAVIAATPERGLELARTDERLVNWLACYLDSVGELCEHVEGREIDWAALRRELTDTFIVAFCPAGSQEQLRFNAVQRVGDALDAARWRVGEIKRSVRRAIEDHPELGPELLPLFKTAVRLHRARVDIEKYAPGRRA